MKEAVLAVAGVIAGIVGTAGGITSLVSYPALLAVGVPPLAASIANIVALVSCWPGSALSSRTELEGRAGWLWRWVPVSVAGGVAGSALLLSTPASAFRAVVPYLVLAGSLTLLVQPRISALAGHRARGNVPLLLGGLLFVSVYNGYFGAGAGVMTLALLLISVDGDLSRSNALKNMLVGAATVVSAVTFVIFGHVLWSRVLPLMAGMFIGATIGPVVTRSVPAHWLRWTVAAIGAAFAGALWARVSWV